jgi:hypothetical protein
LLRRVIDDLAGKLAATSATAGGGAGDVSGDSPAGRAAHTAGGDAPDGTPACGAVVASWCSLPLPLQLVGSGAEVGDGPLDRERAVAAYNAHLRSAVAFGNQWLASARGRAVLRGAAKLVVTHPQCGAGQAPCAGVDSVRLLSLQGVAAGAEAFAVAVAAALDSVRVRCIPRSCHPSVLRPPSSILRLPRTLPPGAISGVTATSPAASACPLPLG